MKTLLTILATIIILVSSCKKESIVEPITTSIQSDSIIPTHCGKYWLTLQTPKPDNSTGTETLSSLRFNKSDDIITCENPILSSGDNTPVLVIITNSSITIPKHYWNNNTRTIEGNGYFNISSTSDTTMYLNLTDVRNTNTNLTYHYTSEYKKNK